MANMNYSSKFKWHTHKKKVQIYWKQKWELPFNNGLKAKILGFSLVSFCVFVYFKISINNIFGHHRLAHSSCSKWLVVSLCAKMCLASCNCLWVFFFVKMSISRCWWQFFQSCTTRMMQGKWNYYVFYAFHQGWLL